MNEKILQKSICWKKGYSLTLEIHSLLKQFPKEELYCLTAQMRRCVMSIPLNISEGLLRNSKKELARFFIVARGSCGELTTQLLLARDFGYITEAKFNTLNEKTNEIARILTASIKTLTNRS